METWYREHVEEASKIIQSSYLIKKTTLWWKVGNVDMTRGYMKEDIGYSIILLSKVMGLPIVRHLNFFMVHFIETIKKENIPLDWASTLSKKLCDQLQTVKEKKKFYMTSYVVYLLAVRATNYLKLYKKGSM